MNTLAQFAGSALIFLFLHADLTDLKKSTAKDARSGHQNQTLFSSILVVVEGSHIQKSHLRIYRAGPNNLPWAQLHIPPSQARISLLKGDFEFLQKTFLLMRSNSEACGASPKIRAHFYRNDTRDRPTKVVEDCYDKSQTSSSKKRQVLQLLTALAGLNL